MVPCTSTVVGDPYVNVIGGVVDEEQFIAAMNTLYCDQALRRRHEIAGIELAGQKRFRWSEVGRRWADVVKHALSRREVAA